MTDSEVTLRARPTLSLVCATMFALWVAAVLGTAAYRDLHLGDLVVSLLGFGLPALLIAAGSLPRWNYLRLTSSYFEYRVSFVQQRFSWKNVGQFRVRRHRFRQMVTFEGLGSHATPTMGLLRGFGPEGREHMLPGKFGESAEALAKRMNRWRNHVAPVAEATDSPTTH